MEAQDEKKKHSGRHSLDHACADHGDRFTRLHSNDTEFGDEFQRRSNRGSGHLRIQPDPNCGRAVRRPTPTLTPTTTPTLTLIDINATEASATPTPSCYRLRWIKDVTVPDFTLMTPGETFTKTWLVSNSGTCAWQLGFQFAFYGGDPMGGSNYTLTQAVNPGDQMDLSIPMTAPSGTGIIISTWRMSGFNGWFFGDALTVKIDLGGETPTP